MGTCGYVNPQTDPCWSRDYRIYDPAGDGHRNLDHVRARLSSVVYPKTLPFQAVLRDTWDATNEVMRFSESLRTHDYGPLTDNRHVDDSGGQPPYHRVDSLAWNETARAHGKPIQLNGFPKDHQVRLFRVTGSTHRTDWMVSNDQTQDSTAATQAGCGYRWKIEPLHRAGKQSTGLERCQCRKARSQRNPIGGALLVWVSRKELAAQTGRTGYQLKQGLRDDYLIQQLKNPSLKMVFA